MAVSYSNRIRSLRKKLKMTQKQMAEQLFIDQSTLATYENRTREIPIDILVKLSKIYGISVDYLFCVSDFAVLDDALVRCDDARCRKALELLYEESKTRQILLFTCQHRESAFLAGRSGVTVLSL